MCPKFYARRVLPYIKCHVSTHLLTFLKLCLSYCQKLLEVASVTLRNAHEENKRTKSERSFALLFFKLSLGFELDFECGLRLGLELGLKFGLGLWLGLGLG